MIFARTATAEAAPAVRDLATVIGEINATDAALAESAAKLKAAFVAHQLDAQIVMGRVQLRPGLAHEIHPEVRAAVQERETLQRKWSELLQEYAGLKKESQCSIRSR